MNNPRQPKLETFTVPESHIFKFIYPSSIKIKEDNKNLNPHDHWIGEIV